MRTNNPMMRTTATNAYSAFPYYYVVRGGKVEGSLTSSTTSGSLPVMRRKKNKRKKKLDLGPSHVAVEAHRRKGGVHDDQKVNHRRDRKAAKQALKEQND